MQFTIDERRRLSDEKLLASLREYDAELYEKTRAATSLGLTHWAWYGPGHSAIRTRPNLLCGWRGTRQLTGRPSQLRGDIGDSCSSINR